MDTNNSTNTLEKIDAIIAGFFSEFRFYRGLISVQEDYFFYKARSIFCAQPLMIDDDNLPFNVSIEQIRLINSFIHAYDFTDLYLACRSNAEEDGCNLDNYAWDSDFALDYLQYFSLDALVYFSKKVANDNCSCFDADLYEEIIECWDSYNEINALKYTYLHGLCKNYGQSRKILVNEFDETELTVIFMDMFRNIAIPYIKGYFYVPNEDEDSDACFDDDFDDSDDDLYTHDRFVSWDAYFDFIKRHDNSLISDIECNTNAQSVFGVLRGDLEYK